MKNVSIISTSIFLVFLFSFDIAAQCPTAEAGHHRVQKGETLYRISKKYNVTVDQICGWNNISKSSVLLVCQDLVIIAPSSTAIPPNNTVRPKPKKQEGTHKIKPGETIAGIAELYGFTEQKFREINGLNETEPAWPGLYLRTSDCNCPNPNLNTEADYIDVAENNTSNFENDITTNSNSTIPTWKEAIAADDEPDDLKNEDPFGEDPFMENGNSVTTYNRTSSSENRPATYSRRVEKITAPNSSPNKKSSESQLDSQVKRSSSGLNAPTKTYISPEEELIRQTRRSSASSRNTTQKNKTIDSSNPAVTKDAARYMTTDEISMVNEINLVRSNPSAYVKYVEAYKNKIAAGKAFGTIETCNELISELRRLSPLSRLKPAECLYNAAKKHGLDQKPTGSTDHVGTDGSYPWDRVRKECSFMTDGNENLVAGPESVRDAVILLLVDEGIPNRGHRRTLLNRDWNYVACYKIGQVGNMPNSWVQNFGK